jgi:hypothetical protein
MIFTPLLKAGDREPLGRKGKRMVNIDDFIFVKRNQIWCYDLHVTGQNNKVDLVLFSNSICCFSPDSLLSLVKGTWKNGILN